MNYYNKKVFFLSLFFFFLIVFIWPLEVEAGCCECGPPIIGGNGTQYFCGGGENNPNFQTPDSCNIFCLAAGYNVPPNSNYPIFSHFCNTENSCPVGEAISCCLHFKSSDNIVVRCTDGLRQDQCKPEVVPVTLIAKYHGGESCEELKCDEWIGLSYLNALQTPPVKESKPVIFTPQVSIPGSIQFGGKIFSINKGQDIQVNGELLSKYIAVLFNWLIGAIGVIVVAYMGFGGMQWLAAAGSAEGINKAKETIRDSMIGLLLVVSSYTVLYFINPNLVGFKILDIPIVSPLYLEFDEGDISVGKGVQRDAGGYSSVEGLICYKQAWEPWGGKLYGDCEPSNGKDSNYANAACGPTSVAMVVSSLTSQSVEPNIIGQKMISGGYRPCGSGTSLDGIMKVPLQYGLKTSSVNWNGVTQCLQNGGYVVARMWGPGKGKPQVCSRFTNNGHYIVIGGINGNKVQINDSAGSYPRKNTDYKGTEGGINGCYREDNIDDVKSCGVDYVCISK